MSTNNFGGGQFKESTPTELRYEALNLFLGDSTNMIMSPTSGGVNNICDYVVTPTGEKYVLRIYNNGRDSVRVDFEHQVLDALLSSGQQFSFRLPTAVTSKVNGLHHVMLSNGAEATLFEFIPGELPKKSRVREIGRASGELVSALGHVNVDVVSPNPRFCDLFKAHHATTSEIFFAEMKKSQFDITPETRRYADLLCGEVVDILKKVEHMKTLTLPVQLIHADLHYDNVLVDGDLVSGLLDFEFSVHDWRACELAVSLSKYAGEKEALTYFREFVDGFKEHGRLNSTEISCIPDLIILRILSNVVYFVGRAYAGEDTIDSLTSRAELYFNRIKWIKEQNQAIIDIVAEKIIA